MRHKRVFIFIGCLPSFCRARAPDFDRLPPPTDEPEPCCAQASATYSGVYRRRALEARTLFKARLKTAPTERFASLVGALWKRARCSRRGCKPRLPKDSHLW